MNGNYDEGILVQNTVEGSCSNDIGPGSGVVQNASGENGGRFEDNIEFCDHYTKFSQFNSEEDGQNLSQRKTTFVENRSGNGGQIFSKEKVRCFKKQEVEIREDDMGQPNSSVDEGKPNIAFQPVSLSPDVTSGILMDEIDTAKGMSGSKRDLKGACEVVVNGTDGSTRDNGCVSSDNDGISVDNRDIKCQDEETPSRYVAERIDDLSESSDEDLEEIVYKGEMG